MAQKSDTHQFNILRISDEKTLQLVISYGKEPCLWNTSLEDYKRKEARVAAAERIAKALDVPNFEAKHVMIKFKNLRNSYSQELKKIAASLESGKTGDELYQPKVLWFHHMDEYLRPYLQSARTKWLVDQLTGESMLAAPNQVSTCRTIQVKEEIDDSESSLQDWYPVSNYEQLLVPEESCRRSKRYQSSEDEHKSNESRKLKRLREESNDDSLEQPINSRFISSMSTDFLKTIAGNLEILTRQKEDHFEIFGRYIASVLRGMPAQQAVALQPKIVSLVTTGLTGDDAVSQSDGR